MLTQPLKLRFPIELPGGTVSEVTPRPVTGSALDRLLSGDADSDAVVARCLRLPIDVVCELEITDHDRIARAIASLSGAAVAEARAEHRGNFQVITGGRQ
ncbi:hypothetical protein [Croceicoccus naphthovorans]|uniref:Uncharacterized protein n=1 Tax=Croceicoccus naphthovorans TaxID=1348774 RepID=A0A0G3XFV7_9SPHN|nr:hypothetical protein [Croceicoccus naphthovorans]AKM10037.1 hypothetical protein AB433_08700 [Croceicoccus naphthovorans]MBB3991073.1 hypothetical protein [Croceicoccus naphthovorans]